MRNGFRERSTHATDSQGKKKKKEVVREGAEYPKTV